jgi:hypothetical protein
MFLAVVAGGFLFLSGNIFEEPRFEGAEGGRVDSSSALSRLAELVQRDAGHSGRQDPVVLGEREITALVARHLADTAGLRFDPFIVRLTPGQFVLQGRTIVGNLLKGPPFAQVASQLPAAQLRRPIWITARGDISLEPGDPGGRPGRARLTLTEFTLGKQPVGTWPFSIVMGPAGSRLLKWEVPGSVRSIEIEDRRVVIRTR